METRKLNRNIVSLPLIRRGNWYIKTSVFLGTIMIVTRHVYKEEVSVVRYFRKNEDAANYIEMIVKKDGL